MGLLGPYSYQALWPAALFFTYVLFKQWKKKRNNSNGLPLPPGPKGYPLIGNLFDFPIHKPWLVYEEWCKTYGDIVYFNVLGHPFLVLGSLKRSTDLLEKRSSNYSDRMRLPMVVELMKWDFIVGFLAYGAAWRKQRKVFHDYFQPNAVYKFYPDQRRAVHAFLRRVLVTPDNFLHHVQHLFGTITMKVTYGIDVQEHDDPYIHLAEESLMGLNQAGVPGAFWVDLFPILKYVPRWLPGAGFQKKAAYWGNVNVAMVEKPFAYVKEQLKMGKVMPSIAASLIECLPEEDHPQRAVEEKLAKDVSAGVYAAGADTTISIVQAIFMVLALYPEAQKKGQAEIDAVVGPNRLPDFDDRPSLPYIQAMIKELMRWHLVAPLAFGHMATNDDEYDGYYIPKGTVVFGNAWSILHDPKIFNDPMEYRPERYLKDGKLNPEVRNPDLVAFGFGRRICPGRYFSSNVIYLVLVCFLAVFDTKAPVDDQGNITLKAEFGTGMMSYPIPYKCIIKPRSAAATELVLDSANRDN